MALPIPSSVTRTAEQVTGTTYTVTMPPGIVAGDTIIVMLSQDGSTESLGVASSGFTALGTQVETAGAAASGQPFFKVAVGGETTATFACANDHIIGTAFLIKDSHATAPFGATPTSGTNFVRTGWNAAITAASGTGLTPPEADCLLIYIWTSDNTNQMRIKSDDLIALDSYAGTISSASHVIGYRQQGAATAIPNITMYCSVSGEGGDCWVLAIRNKSGGSRAVDLRSGIDEWLWYGNFGELHAAYGTPAAPNTIAATINGTTVHSAAGTITHAYTSALSSIGTMTTISNGETIADAWVGSVQTVPGGTKDLTGKLLYIQFNHIYSLSRTGSKGVAIVFSDGTNWVAYTLATKDKLIASADQIAIIALGHATPLDSSGTMTWGANTKVLLMHHRTAPAGGAAGLVTVKNCFLLSTSIITGGGADYPATFASVQRALTSWGFWKLAELLGDAFVLGKSSLQIGDGIEDTYFDGSGSAFAFPTTYSTVSGSSQQEWNVDPLQVSVTVKGSADDTILLSAGVLSSSTAQSFIIDAAHYLSSSVSFSGESFIGLTIIDNAGETWTSPIFKRGDTVTIAAGGDLNDCSISKTTSTNAALSIAANGSVLTRTSVTVGDTAIDTDYHLELKDTATAVSLTDFNFSGTPTLKKVHILKTTGNVEITIDGTTSLVDADITSAGATWDILAPTINQSVVLTGLSTTCRVQLYDASVSAPVGSRILYNGEPGTTSYTWEDPAVAVASRAIRLRITDYLGATAKVMIERNIGTCGTISGTESISFNNEFEEDTNYNTQAAALGYTGEDITDIEIDDSTNTVKFNFLAGGDYDARRIYMYMVYWLDTEVGINDDFVFCRPLDPVNLPMEGVVFENVTSPQEIITFINAYVYDKDTGRAKDLVVGDGINFAPDHVVQVIATVSGVNTITGTIDDVAGKVQEGLTAQGLTTTRAAKLDNMDQKVSRVLISTIATR